MKIYQYLVNRRLTHCLLNLGLVVSICGCGPAAIVDKKDVSLSLLSPEVVDSHLKDTQNVFKDSNKKHSLVLEMENKIALLCGVKGSADDGIPDPEFREAISGVAGTLIVSTVSFIFDKIKDSLKKILQRYTSTYKGTKADYVYSSWDNEKDKDDKKNKKDLNAVTQKHTCVRLTRVTKTGDEGADKKEKRVLDFVAQLRMVKSTPMTFNALAKAEFTKEFEKNYQKRYVRNIYSEETLRMREFASWRAFVRNLEYFEVTPLRLAVNGMVAESDNDEYTLSIGLKMDSVWFHKNGGRQNTITHPILTTEFEVPEDGQFVEYYFKGVDDDSLRPTDAKPVIFPVIPYSSGFPKRDQTDGSGDQIDGSGMTRFEMAVSEVGVPSNELAAAIAIFGASSDDLAGLVSDTLKKKLKLEDE